MLAADILKCYDAWLSATALAPRTRLLLNGTTVVNPFSGVHLPTAWQTWLAAALCLAFVALCLWVFRERSYDDHTARSYAAGARVFGVLATIALTIGIIIGINELFSSVGASGAWAIWIAVGMFLAFLALCFWVSRQNAYDDRTAWNYAAATFVCSALAVVALLVGINELFSSLGDLGGEALALLVLLLLIVYGDSRSSYRRWP